MQQSPIREKRFKGQGRNSETGKQKFQQERVEKAKAQTITPMNKKQAEYLELLNDTDVSVIIATGYARNFQNMDAYRLGL